MELIDSITRKFKDESFFVYKVNTPFLTIFKVPYEAIVVGILCFYFSWRLCDFDKLFTFQLDPFFVRIGRLGFGLPVEDTL